MTRGTAPRGSSPHSGREGRGKKHSFVFVYQSLPQTTVKHFGGFTKNIYSWTLIKKIDAYKLLNRDFRSLRYRDSLEHNDYSLKILQKNK